MASELFPCMIPTHTSNSRRANCGMIWRRRRAKTSASLLFSVGNPLCVVLGKERKHDVGTFQDRCEVGCDKPTSLCTAVEIKPDGLIAMVPDDRKAIDEIDGGIAVAPVGIVIDVLAKYADRHFVTGRSVAAANEIHRIVFPVVLQIFFRDRPGNRLRSAVDRKQQPRR